MPALFAACQRSILSGEAATLPPGARWPPKGVGRGTAKSESPENAWNMEIIWTFPPAFLFSHEIAFGDFMTASPREKRRVLPHQWFFDSLKKEQA